ncbi:hypothetical protein C5612_22925 [Pseudomonas frederiksbergensis]|uniref:Uncharacterized protein n=1 Tax=Pseudomonas frederiksbergensis TaxID=104087 RepID=A0A2S8HD04_9PSED|nr:hypothetical protein C5612_22925 [Pseudomonas frederiksbergensis]
MSTIHVGAGLLAKRAAYTTLMSPDTPLSRASPLPQVLRLTAITDTAHLQVGHVRCAQFNARSSSGCCPRACAARCKRLAIRVFFSR